MPTGYTAKLYEGEQSLQSFVMQCADAFLGTARGINRASDVDYYTKTLANQKFELDKFLNMSWEDRAAKQKYEHECVVMARKTYIEQSKAREKRYEDMMEQVRKWLKGTEDENIQALKNFMLEQLRESMRFDCAGDYSLPQMESVEEWSNNTIEQMQNNIVYYEEELAKAQEKLAGEKDYIKILADSFKNSDKDFYDAK